MTDLIDRQEAIKMFEPWLEVNGYSEGELNVIRAVIVLLNKLPSTQPERKTGKWLPDNNCYYETRFVCSCCKDSEVVPTVMYKPIWNYCPNCGAKMGAE